MFVYFMELSFIYQTQLLHLKTTMKTQSPSILAIQSKKVASILGLPAMAATSLFMGLASSASSAVIMIFVLAVKARVFMSITT